MIKRYRKKPVVIEAMLLTNETRREVIDWINDNGGKADSYRQPNSPIIITTLEGDMTGTLGDYIIKGVQSEFYPCKPQIFNASYERVK